MKATWLGYLCQVQKGAVSPSYLCQDAMEGQAVGQVLLMLQRGLGASLGWGCDREADGISEDGKDTGERRAGRPQGAAGRWDRALLLSLQTSLASPSHLFPSILSDPSMY